MDNAMFCYQCEQTMGGKGCTKIGVCGKTPEVANLQDLLIYQLKGISCYAKPLFDFYSDQVDQFYFRALGIMTNDNVEVEELIRWVMRTGEIAIEVMRVLDDANTTRYKNPTPHKVNVNIKKGPFIVVSGHDLRDLEMLLEQSEGKGINIYTHGEMLPSHGYDGLKKYKHLVGNFGSAWQNQQKEFDNIPGCILMTTNCLMKPRESYKDRIYSTSVVGWDGIVHIGRDENGYKDFSEIIDKALELGGFEEDQEEHEILVGFAHKSTLSHADKIVESVKEGKLRHFFVIGGCDGARP